MREVSRIAKRMLKGALEGLLPGAVLGFVVGAILLLLILADDPRPSILGDIIIVTAFTLLGTLLGAMGSAAMTVLPNRGWLTVWPAAITLATVLFVGKSWYLWLLLAEVTVIAVAFALDYCRAKRQKYGVCPVPRP